MDNVEKAKKDFLAIKESLANAESTDVFKRIKGKPEPLIDETELRQMRDWSKISGLVVGAEE